MHVSLYEPKLLSHKFYYMNLTENIKLVKLTW